MSTRMAEAPAKWGPQNTAVFTLKKVKFEMIVSEPPEY